MKLTIRTKVLSIATLLAFVLVGIIIYIVVQLEKSADEIVESSKQITESAVHQLRTAGARSIDSLVASDFFSHTPFTKFELRHADSLLSNITSSCLSSFQGMEGGYYFPQIDEFLGYSFPTSPPPKPVFGPPPRSYVIIHDQAIQSIKEKRVITQVHQFDPARFPLVTEPIEQNGVIIGCVWTRVHIERLIPTFSLIDVLVAAASIFLVGFAIVFLFSWNMRKRIEEIRLGLQLLHTDGTFRFRKRRGVFEEITHSINEMIEARAVEQEKREKLERDLHQQDKMVTLGRMIAGVAHEVKTPLAVIKTRIQMWDRKLRQKENQPENGEVVTTEAMDLVVHEINRLSDLVKRLLVFAKPVANKLRPTDINQLLLQTLAVIQPVADEKEITIQTRCSSNLPFLNLDPQTMEQVFLNVMTNSLEAMQANGVLQIRSNLSAESASVVIEIEDTGNGIPEEAMEKIFNPFFTTKDSGAGLGLSISYEIVRAHHGTIEFPKSNPTGTICRITFPVSLS